MTGTFSIYSTYVNEIPKERLTADEEKSLSKRILEENDKKAEIELVEKNLSLVISIAKKYITHASIEDLIQAGNEGLLRAVRRFDYKKGFRFSTYAYAWIQQSIFKYLDDTSSLIKVPKEVLHFNRELNKATNVFISEHQREPETDEIIEMLGYSESLADRINDANKDIVSMDIAEWFHSANNNVEKQAFNSVLSDLLESEFSKILTERQAIVLRMHFIQGITLDQISDSLGITKARAMQIEAAAIRKLGASRELKNYYFEEEE